MWQFPMESRIHRALNRNGLSSVSQRANFLALGLLATTNWELFDSRAPVSSVFNDEDGGDWKLFDSRAPVSSVFDDEEGGKLGIIDDGELGIVRFESSCVLRVRRRGRWQIGDCRRLVVVSEIGGNDGNGAATVAEVGGGE
ncbi:hypothetical protein Drorol1_Dr00012173 [Drosera rotundifolia]